MLYILIITLSIVVSTVAYGLVENYKEDVLCKNKIKRAITANLAAFIPVIAAALIFMVPDIVHAANVAGATSSSGLGYIGAALSTGLAAIGAGYAVGATGSAALGAVSEDPKILGKTLLYVGLAEGIALYGMIISLMILSKL